MQGTTGSSFFGFLLLRPPRGTKTDKPEERNVHNQHGINITIKLKSSHLQLMGEYTSILNQRAKLKYLSPF